MILVCILFISIDLESGWLVGSVCTTPLGCCERTFVAETSEMDTSPKKKIQS